MTLPQALMHNIHFHLAEAGGTKHNNTFCQFVLKVSKQKKRVNQNRCLLNKAK